MTPDPRIANVRSADFLSAVSPIWNRQGAGIFERARFFRRAAGYKPAIRPTSSLRYAGSEFIHP